MLRFSKDRRGPLLLCIFLVVSSTTPVFSSSRSHEQTAVPQNCSICGHELQKLVLVTGKWSVVLSSIESAEHQGFHLELDEEEIASRDITKEWDEEADEDDCHASIASLKNALWSITRDALHSDGNLTAWTEHLKYLQQQVKKILNYKNPAKRIWTSFDDVIQKFELAARKKFERVVTAEAVQILKSGNSVEQAAQLLTSSLDEIDVRTMDYIVNASFVKGTKLDVQFTSNILELGELLWPSNTPTFYKKVTLRLANILAA